MKSATCLAGKVSLKPSCQPGEAARAVSGTVARMAAKKQHKWRIYLLRKKGEFIGSVEAPDRETAIKLAVEQFAIRDPERQKRLSAERAD
jgi:hypothetical protein